MLFFSQLKAHFNFEYSDSIVVKIGTDTSKLAWSGGLNYVQFSDFDFDLPTNLIAQTPFFPKEKTKMLVSCDAKILDAQLINLTDFLQEGDVMVFNDAKVIKAKLSAKILRNSEN